MSNEQQTSGAEDVLLAAEATQVGFEAGMKAGKDRGREQVAKVMLGVLDKYAGDGKAALLAVRRISTGIAEAHGKAGAQ